MIKKYTPYIIAILLITVTILTGIIFFQKNQYEKDIIKEKETKAKELQKAIEQKDIEISKNLTNLKDTIQYYKNNKPKPITRYVETIYYIDHSDSTLIRKITRETNRYRENRKKQMDTIK